MSADEQFMRAALAQARRAYRAKEAPIGCVIVCDGKIKGNLFVDVSVTIGPNAVVFGNIRSAEINIDPGAIIKGSIEVVRQSMAAVRAFDFEEEFLNIDDYLAGMQ